MGRILSDTSALSGTGSNNGNVLAGIVSATKIVPAGYMGEFGNGLWQVFQASGVFVVPDNVRQLRVRTFGGGGGGGGSGASGTQVSGVAMATKVAPAGYMGEFGNVH